MAKKNKIKYTIFAAVALVLGLVALFAFWYINKPRETANNTAVTEYKKLETEKNDAEAAKSQANKNSMQATQQQSAPTATPASVAISSIGASSGSVYVNALVSGATSGTCKLTLTNGSTKLEKSAPIGLQVSYYICQGFSISASEFVPKGEWSALIDITTPDGNARSEIKKVDVL